MEQNRREFLTGAAWMGAAAMALTVLCADAEVTVHTAEDNGVALRWFEEMVPMKDGVKLYTYGVLPPEGVKCGIVFKRTPYEDEKRVDMRSYAKSQLRVLKRGYAYVNQHVRGMGMSEGEWVPYVNEREDGLTALEWIRKLPHYSGEIFLHGGSYLSSVHLSYLDTNPPDVKGAQLNVQDLNRYNIHYRNGNYKIALHGNWMVKRYKKKNTSLKRDLSVKFTDLPLTGFSIRRLGEYVADLEETWKHPRPEDPWWRTTGTAGFEYRNALLKSTIPVMMLTGEYDIYTEGLLDMWREMPPSRRANCALVVDAFDHDGHHKKGVDKSSPVYFPNGSRFDADAVDSVFDWFDWCRGKGKLKHVRPGETRWYALWENRWHSSPEMKDAEGLLTLYFTSDRHLALEPAAPGGPEISFFYDPKSPPSFPGAGCLTFGGMQAQPKPNFRDDVISFLSHPADRNYNVQGRMRMNLAVKSDRDDTTFFVRVSIRKRDGNWYTLRDDIKAISWDHVEYAPGKETSISYVLSDHAFTVEKGDCLRVDVAGADASKFIPHTNFKGPFVEQAASCVAHNAIIPEKCAFYIPIRK